MLNGVAEFTSALRPATDVGNSVAVEFRRKEKGKSSSCHRKNYKSSK